MSRLRQLPGIGALLLVASASSSYAQIDSAVQLLLIEGVREFPDATEPGSIRYACAASRDRLSDYFASRGLRFEPKLVRKRPGHGLCHIHYEATIPGFRASPEAEPITQLFGAVNPIGLVPGRKPVGESLDIIKEVLRQLPRPIAVTISVGGEFDDASWAKALATHFPSTAHRISRLRRPSGITHPWAQDYVKSGETNGRLRVLVPRRLYEGRAEDGEWFRPLLDAMGEKPFVRSKLSWEGGDLQFAVNPKDPSQRILVYGRSAREYWGAGLDPLEYEYVLRTEFGADRAINVGKIGPHADFLVSFLPAGNIVLVAEPEQDNYALAREAAATLVSYCGIGAPKELLQLVGLLDGARDQLLEDLASIRRLTRWLRQNLPPLLARAGAESRAERQRYLHLNCPGNPELCFEPGGLPARRSEDLGLLRRYADGLIDQEFQSLLTPWLLNLIESQMPGAPAWDRSSLDISAGELRELGFRVVRAPYLLAPEVAPDWDGLSYLNVLAFDQKLFVPKFGLGPAEDQILAKLEKKLEKSFQLIPVRAEFSLTHNGGVHCVFGIVRNHVPAR
jgi:hypothetical protein